MDNDKLAMYLADWVYSSSEGLPPLVRLCAIQHIVDLLYLLGYSLEIGDGYCSVIPLRSAAQRGRSWTFARLFYNVRKAALRCFGRRTDLLQTP